MRGQAYVVCYNAAVAKDWLDVLREKQARASRLRAELEALEAELRDAKAILSGKVDATTDITIRPKSRHGFTGGKRAKPIQKDSSVWWTRRVLKTERTPLHLDHIITRIEALGGPKVAKATLASNLSRYVTHGDTFTRTGPNVFGLIDYDQPEDVIELPYPIGG